MQLVKQLHDAKTGVPVIVLTVPQNPVRVDPGKGIDEVLSMPFNGYDLITRGSRPSTRPPPRRPSVGPSRLIVVFAPKGGVGKTTIAFNLAVAAAGLGARTALVDGSIQFGDLRGAPAGAARRAVDARPADRPRSPRRISPTCSGAGPPTSTSCSRRRAIEMAEMVLIRDLEKTLSLMRRLYDLVIVDTGVGLDELTLALLDQADTILEIVTYDATTIRNTIAMAETFQKIGYPPSKVQYLVNRADASGRHRSSDLRDGPRPRAGVQDPLRGPGRRSGEQPGRAVRDRRARAGVSQDVIEVARQLFGVAAAAQPRRRALARSSGTRRASG